MISTQNPWELLFSYYNERKIAFNKLSAKQLDYIGNTKPENIGLPSRNTNTDKHLDKCCCLSSM